jgi:uncharacterized protein
MLTGDLLRFTRRQGRVHPRLIDPGDPKRREQAQGLIAEIESHVGKARGELEASLEALAPAGPQHAVERGLCKLLLDRCTFEARAETDPIALRVALFDQSVVGWRTRSLAELPQWRAEVVADVAARGGISSTAAEASLYADLEANQVLVGWESLTPEKLLLRYNVSLVQGLLLRADTVEVRAAWPEPARLRQLFRWLKFFGLLFQPERAPSGELSLHLSGPLTILEHSSRYGLNLAQFFAALLLWPGPWTLTAHVRVGRRPIPADLILEPDPWLKSPLPDHGAWVPEAVREFADQFNGRPGPWRAVPAERLLLLPGNAFLIPDLEFVAGSGERVLLEHVLYPAPERIGRHLEWAEAAAQQPGSPPIARYILACRRVAGLPEHPLLIVYRRNLLASQVRQKLDHLEPGLRPIGQEGLLE